MENVKSIIVVVLLGCCMACQTSQNERISGASNILTIPVLMENESLKLSQIADSVRYIPLSNEQLLMDVKMLKVDNQGNFYVVTSDDNGVYKFDKNGQFVCQISRKGQGPEEYVRLEDFDLYGDTVFVNTGAQSVLYFDRNGQFLHKKKDLTGSEIFIALSGDTVYGSNCRVLKRTVNGESEVYRFDTSEEMLLASHRTHFTRNGSQIYWEDQFKDTLYVMESGSPVPFLAVDFGKLKLPSDMKITNEIFANPKVKRYCHDPMEFRISDDYISFMFKFAEYGYTCIYNRHISVSHTFKSIQNDIDELPIMPVVLAISGKKIYVYANTSYVAAYYAALKEQKEEVYQKMAKRFETVLGKIPDEMDNPILVEITCK